LLRQHARHQLGTKAGAAWIQRSKQRLLGF
jgi:hypothetical protein